MDMTTILAIVACTGVFSAWLVLPHSVASRPVEIPDRLAAAVSA